MIVDINISYKFDYEAPFTRLHLATLLKANCITLNNFVIIRFFIIPLFHRKNIDISTFKIQKLCFLLYNNNAISLSRYSFVSLKRFTFEYLQR